MDVNTRTRLASVLACGSLFLPFAGIAACNHWAPNAVHMEEALQSVVIGGLFCVVAAILGVLTLVVATQSWQRVFAAIGLIAGVGLIASVLIH